MSYDKTHTEDDCDKCLSKVGKANLFRVGFLYLDRNDRVHENLGNDYHQYYVCKECAKQKFNMVDEIWLMKNTE
jgi:hypothetical protein